MRPRREVSEVVPQQYAAAVPILMASMRPRREASEVNADPADPAARGAMLQ